MRKLFYIFLFIGNFAWGQCMIAHGLKTQTRSWEANLPNAIAPRQLYLADWTITQLVKAGYYSHGIVFWWAQDNQGNSLYPLMSTYSAATNVNACHWAQYLGYKGNGVSYLNLGVTNATLSSQNSITIGEYKYFDTITNNYINGADMGWDSSSGGNAPYGILYTHNGADDYLFLNMNGTGPVTVAYNGANKFYTGQRTASTSLTLTVNGTGTTVSTTSSTPSSRIIFVFAINSSSTPTPDLYFSKNGVSITYWFDGTPVVSTLTGILAILNYSPN